MSKEVLILGHQGTLGQELIKEFTKAGYNVIGWDKDDLDVTAPGLEVKITAVKPDIIIYAIGYNAVDKAETDENEAKMALVLNAEVPEKLSRLANKLNSIFVTYSTDYVFKGDKPEGYTESDKPEPQTIYGKSKYEGEKKVISSGIKYYIIRPSRIFGIKGASPNSKRSFVEIMLTSKNESELKVKNGEKGSPTYAPDLAKFTHMLVESGKPWGIYHGTNEGSCTWFEWAQEIFKILGAGPKLIPVDPKDYVSPAVRPAFSPLINTKFTKQRTWQAALNEFLTKKLI